MHGKTLIGIGSSIFGGAFVALIAWLSTPLRSEPWFLLVTCGIALVGATVFVVGWAQIVVEGRKAAIRSSKENNVRRLELTGELLTVRGQIAEQEQFLVVAESYDPLRATIINGTLGELRGRESRLQLTLDALDD